MISDSILFCVQKATVDVWWGMFLSPQTITGEPLISSSVNSSQPAVIFILFAIQQSFLDVQTDAFGSNIWAVVLV